MKSTTGRRALISNPDLLFQVLVNSLTALLNVRSCDTLKLLKNLDDRVNTGKCNPEQQCSFQVLNAYYAYLDFLPIIDKKQFRKYRR